MEISVRTRQIDSTTYRIALTGEFDLDASPEFSHDLNTCIEHGAREVIVDLSAASFVDSTFLGILLGGVTRLRERGGTVTVQCPDSLLEAFAVSGLDRELTINHAPVAVAEPAT